MKTINQEQFTNLVTQNRKKLYRIAFSYVKNEDEALDIVSEAVYKAYVNIKKLKEEKYFLTWMTRIVINTAIDSMRKNSRTVSVESEFLENIIEEKNVEDERVIDLYSAVDRLNADEKAYIILRFFENNSFREISEILNLPESTIKSRVYKCLEKLRNYMEANNDRQTQ